MLFKRFVCAIAVLVLLVGCGKPDLNKNLKPIDPNTPPPKPVGDLQVGGGDGESSGISVPAPPAAQ